MRACDHGPSYDGYEEWVNCLCDIWIMERSYILYYKLRVTSCKLKMFKFFQDNEKSWKSNFV